MTPLSLILLGTTLALSAHADFKSDVAAIRQVGAEGKGNTPAAAAMLVTAASDGSGTAVTTSCRVLPAVWSRPE